MVLDLSHFFGRESKDKLTILEGKFILIRLKEMVESLGIQTGNSRLLILV